MLRSYDASNKTLSFDQMTAVAPDGTRLVFVPANYIRSAACDCCVFNRARPCGYAGGATACGIANRRDRRDGYWKEVT